MVETLGTVKPELAIYRRDKTLVNTDPLRRCYHGAYFSTETRWTRWTVFERMSDLRPGADPQARLKFWRELNDYAVSCRGEGARCEYRVGEV